MRNIDKYEKEIREIIKKRSSIAIDKKTNKLCPCRGQECMECLFFMNLTKYSSNCPAAQLEWLLEEYKELILDDTEKRYLENILRPFKNQVKTIKKNNVLARNPNYKSLEYIRVKLSSTLTINGEETLIFPGFIENTMYKRMDKSKEYTPKELGLFEDEKCKE